MMGHTFGGTTTLISSHLRSMSIFFSTFECVKNRQGIPVSACEGNAIQMSRTAKRRQTGTAPIPANKAPSLAFDSHSGGQGKTLRLKNLEGSRQKTTFAKEEEELRKPFALNNNILR